MGISKSQTYGGMKDTRCTRCGKHLNNLNRIQQDEHEEKCKRQRKLQLD